jgi:hypothetical protein
MSELPTEISREEKLSFIKYCLETNNIVYIKINNDNSIDYIYKLYKSNKYCKIPNISELSYYSEILVYYAIYSHCRKKYKTELKYLQQAIELGNIDAMWRLGIYHTTNKKNGTDYNEALIWLHKAEALNNSLAMVAIGNYYYVGLGGEVDYKEAVKWYQKSAELGNSYGMYKLSICYYKGHGIGQDYDESLIWCKKSIELENISALCHLAECYEKGHGVKQDYLQAIKFYKLSSNKGSVQAEKSLDTLLNDKSELIADIIINAKNKNIELKKINEELKKSPGIEFKKTEEDFYSLASS